MGTSADRATGSGGAWTPLKFAATAYAKSASKHPGGTRIRAERVLGRHVAVLGGPAAATTSARMGRAGFARLGGLLSGIASNGLAPTLEAFGLRDLVGGDRFDVLDELVTLIAGSADDIESQAARDALCDVLDELYEDADSWEELESTAVTEESLTNLLTMFLAHYIYNRLPVLAERLARLVDPVAARNADKQIVEMVRDYVELTLPDDPLSFDWTGDPGQAFADEAVRRIYDILSVFEEKE